MSKIARQKLAQRIESFLYNESCPPPFVFFLVFALSHSEIDWATPNFSYVIFLFAVGVLFACNMNFLFTMAPFIGCLNYPSAIIMFVVCLLACNQKWKAYIFIIAIGDSLTTNPSANSTFLFIAGWLLCLVIYFRLSFRTVQDNQLFFTGFFAVAARYGLKRLELEIGKILEEQYALAFVMVAAALGYSIMTQRLQKLKLSEGQKQKDPRIRAHYLKMIENDLSADYSKLTKITLHRKQCQKPNCFCKNIQTMHKTEYFLRQLYQDSIIQFADRGEPLLWERYIQFLLENKQIINALHFLQGWKTSNFYMVVARIRAEAKIKHVLENENSRNIYQKQYIYALKYDQYCLKLACDINEILKLKTKFWTEVGEETPSMIALQTEGKIIVQKMHELNQQYCNNVKTLQKTLYSFDATVLYGMYLLSTTNFTDYAESIIKNTSKMLEEVYLYENSAAETFAIRTVVEDMRKSYISSKIDCFKLLRDPNVSQSRLEYIDRSDFKLVIDSVSSGFCRLIKFNKADLLGQELNSIIPFGYKEVHNARLNYLLDFYQQELKEIVSSKVMHNELMLPIRGAKGELFMGYICIKFQVDIEKGLTFVSVIKRVHGKSVNAMLDFNGNITEKQESFSQAIIEHSQVQKYIKSLKESWRKIKVIKQQQFNIMINTSNYAVTIGSPLLCLFLQKQGLREKAPPIHVSVVNQETNRFKTVQNDNNNKMAQQIKRMQTAIVNYDTESSAASTKSTVSAINVLSTFSESNSVPVYRCIQVVFLIAIFCCFAANFSFFMTSELQWDATSFSNNPVNDTININTLLMISTKSLLNLADIYFYTGVESYLNTGAVSSYFGSQDYFSSFSSQMAQYQLHFKDVLYRCLKNSSVLLKTALDNRLESVTQIVNIKNGIPIMPNPMISLSLVQIMMNYIQDLKIASTKNTDIQNLVISSTYSVNVVKMLNATEFLPAIEASLDKTKRSSLIIGLSFTFFIMLLLLPLIIVLRKRLPQHEKVFDLIASVEADLIIKEIKSLNYIINILKNYQDSNQILKANIMGYQESQINPKRTSNRRGSADNEIIAGLQKYDCYAVSIANINQSTSIIPSFNLSSTHISKAKLGNTSSLFSAIKQQFASSSKQKELVSRKRAGELQLSGSASDPSNPVTVVHMLICLLIIIFTIFISVNIGNNNSYCDQIQMRANSIIQNFKGHNLFDLQLLSIKLYLRGGSQMLKSIFGISDVLGFLKPIVESVPYYNYQTQAGYQNIIAACIQSNANLHRSYLQKYCQYNHSQLLMLAQFGALFKELIQFRYNIDSQLPFYAQNNLMMLYYYNIFQISEKVFYLQSLNNKIQQNILKITDLKLMEMAQFANEFEQSKIIMLGVSLVWGVFSLVVGFAIILRMKNQYFKEVFTITFLNSEMVVRNKRVQSFIDSLSKHVQK